MRTKLRRLLSDNRGQSMAEYGLLAALIAAALIVTINALKAALQARFETVENALNPTP